MNVVILTGRLTRDPEIKFSQSGMAIGNFNIAVDREYQKKGEEKKTDFFKCTCFGKTAEHVSNYMEKGRLVSVRGSIQNNNYEDKNSVKHYGNDIKVDRVEFLDFGDKKKAESKPKEEADFSSFESVDSSDVPF